MTNTDKTVSAADAIKFLECACRNWSKVPRLSDDDIQDVAEEVVLSSRAASIPKVDPGVCIKPLEWVSEPPYSVARVSSLRLLYSTEAVWDEGVFQYVELRGGFASGDFPTVEEAKAAAQADYEQRIKSALETPPLHKEGDHIPATSEDQTTCDDCAGLVISWRAPDALWNQVMGGPDAKDDPGGIICPNCFIQRAELAGVVPAAWLVDAPQPTPADPVPVTKDD